MSIRILRERFKGITMRYENGGKVQIFEMNGKQASVPADATEVEVQEALEEAFKDKI